MSRAPLVALGLLGAGLAAVVAWQLDLAGGAATPRAPARPVAAAAPREAPPEPAADRNAEWAATILARPLFSPDRRPARAGPLGAVASAPEAPPRLAGILVGPEGRSAIFAAPENRSVVVQEGGRVGAFTVQSIGAGQVVVSGADGPRLLRPSFDPNQPRRAETAPPPRPAAAGAPPLVQGAGGSPTLGPAAGAFPSAPDPIFGVPAAALGSTAASPEGSVPFDQNPAPSGLDILRNSLRRAATTGGTAPSR